MPARIDSGARTFDNGEASFPGPPGRPEKHHGRRAKAAACARERGRAGRDADACEPDDAPRRGRGGRGALFRARRVPADRARGAARFRARAVRRSPASAQARTGVLGDRRGARRARRDRHPRHGHGAAGGRARERPAALRADDPRQGRRAAGRRPRPPVDPDAAPRTRDRAGDEGRSGARPRRRRRRRPRPSRSSRCRSRSASPISRRSSSRSASSRRSCTRWRCSASPSWC